MPDMPQPGPQGGAPGGAPPSGGPQGGGGGIGDAIAQVDQTINKIAQAITASPQAPKDLKDKAQAALSAFRDFAQAVVQTAGGQAAPGGEPDEDDGAGTTTPEQGASGAQPMTHANMRGG